MVNSRWYKEQKKGDRLYNGLLWKNLTLDEMHHFMGMTLRMSMIKTDAGGYTAYFNPEEEEAEYMIQTRM